MAADGRASAVPAGSPLLPESRGEAPLGRASAPGPAATPPRGGGAEHRHAGTCTVSTRLATSRSRSRRAARFRSRRIWLTPSAWSTNTAEKAIR